MEYPGHLCWYRRPKRCTSMHAAESHVWNPQTMTAQSHRCDALQLRISPRRSLRSRRRGQQVYMPSATARLRAVPSTLQWWWSIPRMTGQECQRRALWIREQTPSKATTACGTSDRSVRIGVHYLNARAPAPSCCASTLRKIATTVPSSDLNGLYRVRRQARS